jgi:uncharacterized protein YvpB
MFRKTNKKTRVHYRKIRMLLLVLIFGIIGSGSTLWASAKTYKIKIPTYNQHSNGYPAGCEGVSLYMAMRGMGYLKGISLKKFMSTMPTTSSNPEKGFVGSPKGGRCNYGKRTTINPKPLAKWGSKYGNVRSIQGATTDELKEELRNGHPIVVWVTGGWATPRWRRWSWGRAVTNNHALCLVGYNTKTGKYLVNDCSHGKGTYWVSKSKFEKIYNARKFAVVVE